MAFVTDLRIAFRSLARTKGLALTVVLTLALGIGANAAIFTLVRGVLLKPLVNRDEDRLIYIRQSAPGVGDDNTTFSVPEIQDLRAGVETLSAFGDFSTVGFTMIGWVSLAKFKLASLAATTSMLWAFTLFSVVSSDLKTTAPTLTESSFSPIVSGRPLFRKILRSSAKPFALIAVPLAIGLRSSSVFSNPPSHIPRTPKSSPMSSPARTISPPLWSPAVSIA
jgi:hypothetical protein